MGSTQTKVFECIIENKLFQIHCIPNQNMWAVEPEPVPDDCHDSGVSIPLAVSQG